MYIRRDYSQPFFSTRRRRRTSLRFIFLYALFIGGFLLFVSWQFPRLQLVALDAVGMAPTPTPFASTFAQQGYDLFLAGKLEASAASYMQAVSQQPNNVNYLYEYGRVLIELDRDAAPALGRELGDAEMALQLADEAIEAAPQDPRGYALKARALIWMGDSAAAIPVALSGIEMDSGFAPLYAALAMAYTYIGRYQQGLDYGEQAVTLDPMSVEAHRAFAVSLIWVGLRDEAIRELEDAININPYVTNPYFELAGQYVASNLYEEAVATYEKVLSMDGRNVKAFLRLCEVYSRVGEDRQAEGYCDDALQYNTSDDALRAATYRQLGEVNYKRRNYEGAIENFEACAALGSEQLQCYYLRGLAHYYLGQCDEAWTVLQDSLVRVSLLAEKEPVLSATQEGLRLVTVSCAAYSGRGIPTIEPTAIPPTPIGGIGG